MSMRTYRELLAAWNCSRDNLDEYQDQSSDLPSNICEAIQHGIDADPDNEHHNYDTNNDNNLC